mgnify:CR=1 FL=1
MCIRDRPPGVAAHDQVGVVMDDPHPRHHRRNHLDGAFGGDLDLEHRPGADPVGLACRAAVEPGPAFAGDLFEP